jgi:hypothetical protein
VTNTEPVTVVGAKFVPRERVRVVLIVKRAHAATVAADRRGRFVVRFALGLGECTIIRVRAWGNRGSTASYSIIPSCAQPRGG